MALDDLIKKRAELLAQINDADTELFEQIKAEVEKIDYQIDEEEKQSKAEEKSKQKKDMEVRNKEQEKQINNTTEKILLMDTRNVNEDVEFIDKNVLKISKRALGKQIKAMLNNSRVEFSNTEKRALGIALTTTSETFVAPSASADGINNGGVFIPQTVLLDLLEFDEADSPFLADIKTMNIKGALFFPYVVDDNNGTDVAKPENVDANDRSIHWEKLSLALGNYPITIEVTMELLAMSDEDFINYLLADLSNEINLLLVDEVLYGTGTNNRIEGVTIGAIKNKDYIKGSEAEAIKDGLLTLSKRARKNAKIYLSRSMALDMAFEKDNTGAYIFPIYNNVGINSIATFPVAVEEGLHDGDFVIGNAKNYILNFHQQTQIYPELHGKRRVIEYTAHLMVGGKAAPKKFFYGKLSTTQSNVIENKDNVVENKSIKKK